MRRLLLASALFACRATSPQADPVSDAQASPQANAVPAPIATPTSPRGERGATDAGPPPSALAWGETLERDTAISPPRDGGVAAFSLSATLRVIDPPAVPRAPEVAQAVAEAARKRLDPRLTIDLAPARLRARLDGPGWILPEGTELRARSDRFGHLLVAPDQATYHVLPPGTLRATLGERRLDVAPIATAEVGGEDNGARRLGQRTRKVEVSARSGKATFEFARIEGSADSGPMLTRLLLDLMSVPPALEVAHADEVPLHVEVRWASRGGLVFDVNAVQKRGEFAPGALATPPASARPSTEAIPRPWATLLATPAEVAALHSTAADLGRDAPAATAQGKALVLANGTDTMKVAWVEGVPLAWVAPRGSVELPNVMRGRYVVEWRSFLDDVADAPVTVVAPGTHVVGDPDAGTK